MKKIQKIKITFLVCILSFVAMPAFAARMFFDAGTKELAIGQEFQVDVLLDTEGEDINAVEGTIIFPADHLLFVEVRDGSSVINLWIEPPALKTREKIVFSGIVPGGYNGDKGLIFSLVFKANKDGSGLIEIRDSRALLNDGNGSQAALRALPFEVTVTGRQGAGDKEQETIAEDREPPESFRPEIAQSPDAFEGKYFLIFAAQDKNSGIDRYEVREGSGSFIPARSPYLLKNRKLDKKIFVKAVDKAGNERVEVLYPPNFRPWYKNYENWIIIIAGLLIAAFTAKKAWRRRHM